MTLLLTFKKLLVPKSVETIEVDAVQLWEVRWTSRHNEYHTGTSPEVECFTSQALAENFATALRNAFRLVRHSSGIEVTVKMSIAK